MVNSMDELIKVNENTMTVSARKLHEALGIAKRFSVWFETNSQGFIEGEDYTSVLVGTEVQNNGGIQIRELQDYECSLDMAKHICLMSHTGRSRQYRQYLIEVEKKWNSPEYVMARALKMANSQIDALEADKLLLTEKVEELTPKADFFDAVASSKDAISVSDTAKLLKTGQNRLFRYLRDKKILMRDNRPYQKYMDAGYFRLIEQKYNKPDGETGIGFKTLVTQKGVDFIRRQI